MTTHAVTLAARGWRRLVGGLCAVALVLQIGCYSYLPVQTNLPSTGSRIAVVLNDRGRYVLSDRLGQAIDKVDGLLVTSDAMSVTLDVYRTLDLRGQAATWTGERIQMPREGIAGYQGRQFDRRRTLLLTAAVVGVVTATLLAVNFNLFNGFTREDPGSGQPSDGR